MQNPYNERVPVDMRHFGRRSQQTKGHGRLPHFSTGEFFRDVATVTTPGTKMGIDRPSANYCVPRKLAAIVQVSIFVDREADPRMRVRSSSRYGLEFSGFLQ